MNPTSHPILHQLRNRRVQDSCLRKLHVVPRRKLILPMLRWLKSTGDVLVPESKVEIGGFCHFCLLQSRDSLGVEGIGPVWRRMTLEPSLPKNI